MHPLNNGSQVENVPALKPRVGTAGYFSESNESGSPSYPGQDWFNAVIREFQTALAASGVAFDPDKFDHLSKAIMGTKQTLEVSPLNGDWNGFLDPLHTVPVEFEDTTPGTRSFPPDTEIAPNIYTTDASPITFANDGWFLAGAIYKRYFFTPSQFQLIDIDKINIYIKGNDGSSHYVTNNTAGVSVEKISATNELKVTIAYAVIPTLGISRIWRFFVTEKKGDVRELNPSRLKSELYSGRSNGNYEELLQPGEYASGDYILPLGREITDYATLELHATAANSASQVNSCARASFSEIERYPNNLNIQVSFGVGNDANVIFTSKTEFSVAVAGLYRVRSFIGYLKPGVV